MQASLDKLLELYNNIWISQEFPALWRQSIILPLQETRLPIIDSSPSKIPPTYFLNLHMCKLFRENDQQAPALTQILNEAQSGFRPCRSTTDNLVALQTEIADAYANKQEVVAVIFDIESAFDSTWRPLILNKLAEINLTDNILSFLTNFLTERSSVKTEFLRLCPEYDSFYPSFKRYMFYSYTTSKICPVCRRPLSLLHWKKHIDYM
ncbi:hypothetical protein NQ318_000688 [Aromia moschata]|uniref:Reverse transcriptase domain-containing protein n=1 Tax=Aromia moschata TaxID=1265417 RepID=A0AAV8XG15_9CUCU|nr:hypothetical protein NQ318_000688 [Aromia moschata]